MADRARWKYGSLLIEGHVSMACSPGVIPDQGRMIQPQGTTQPTSAIADLILEWGNTGTWAEVRRWKNCSIVRLEQTHEPYKDTVYTIQDRRWRWKHKFVNGSYNVKDETGTAIGSTLKNAREIATLLLNALGETGYDVTAIPTTASVAPEVHWIYASAADELNKLCGLFGAQVHLRAANTIKLVVNGVGTIPPSTNLIEPVAAGIAFEQPPEKIRAYGSETLFDSWLMLEAVCPEFGGSTAVDSDVKLVDNLSFKPTAGWGNVDPERFLEVVGANDVETKKLRAHCEKFMWRMFRIKGFAGLVTKPPGYDAETDPETGSPYPAVTNMKLLLPLHPTRLQAGIDETGKYVRNPAELAGSFRSADYLGAENLPKYALWKFGFRMDVNNGYVYTNRPCFRSKGYTWEYATPAAMTAGTGYTPTATDLAEGAIFHTVSDDTFWRLTGLGPATFVATSNSVFPPVLYLRTGYGIRKEMYGVRLHHGYELSTGVSNGTGTEPVRKTELQRLVIENYTLDYADFTSRGAEYDNKTAIEASLSAACTQYAQRYIPSVQPQTGNYCIPYSQDTDGLVAQVTWEAGAESDFVQSVSVILNHDRSQKPADQRAAEEKRQREDRLNNQQFGQAQLSALVQQQMAFTPRLITGAG